MKNPTMKDEIREALARGYTYPENSAKVLDAELINAMTEELVKIIDAHWKQFELETRTFEPPIGAPGGFRD